VGRFFSSCLVSEIPTFVQIVLCCFGIGVAVFLQIFPAKADDAAEISRALILITKIFNKRLKISKSFFLFELILIKARAL
jgi:hypothetical protein